MEKQPKIINEVNRTAFEVLITDLETALIFIRIASESGSDSEKKSRNRANGRRAYDTMLRLNKKFKYTRGERKQLDEKFNEVKSALERLGEVL